MYSLHYPSQMQFKKEYTRIYSIELVFSSQNSGSTATLTPVAKQNTLLCLRAGNVDWFKKNTNISEACSLLIAHIHECFSMRKCIARNSFYCTFLIFWCQRSDADRDSIVDLYRPHHSCSSLVEFLHKYQTNEFHFQFHFENSTTPPHKY